MLIKIIIGFIAGIISGLFSTGGGMILVPAFIYLLKIDQRKARATTILCILAMVLATTFFYYKNNYIDWKIGVQCAIGGIIGGFVGTKFLNFFSEKILRITFIIFMLYVGIKFII